MEYQTFDPPRNCICCGQSAQEGLTVHVTRQGYKAMCRACHERVVERLTIQDRQTNWERLLR